MHRIALTAALCAGLAACAAPAPPAGPAPGPTTMIASKELAGTSWNAVLLDGTPPAPKTGATIEFGKGDQAGRAFGSSGCNRWMAGYKQDGSSLKFEQAAGTMMACIGPSMEQEGIFLGIINAVDRFTVDPAGQLVLATPGGKTLTFAPKH